jgi:phosphate acetyltransferase
MFEYQLLQRARAERKHIVLAEGNDDRILRAAGRVLQHGVADLTILGTETRIRSRAAELGVDLSAATVLNPQTSELSAKFAEQIAQLRTDKGVTLEQAQQLVGDCAYFATMLVYNGIVDAMVSGSVHTTAHTVRPALQIIKTKPGVSTVSSIVLMCLADRVLAYGDCSIVRDPTVQQLADIAISSAQTAAQFGIQPRVAMLSYSTGTSGSTGASKAPGSPVAGRATVLIVPDLDTGNNLVKAVQRSAGATAIGPVLQGLNKPVNDLSRGAFIDDIVSTVAVTAIQAQQKQ